MGFSDWELCFSFFVERVCGILGAIGMGWRYDGALDVINYSFLFFKMTCPFYLVHLEGSW